MASPSVQVEAFTVGDLARRFRVSDAVIRRAVDRIGVARRVGAYRIVSGSDVAKVEVALRARGHLRAWKGVEG